MTNYENTNCELSPLDAAMYELIETRKQLEAERAAHFETWVNMAWQIMDLKCREVK